MSTINNYKYECKKKCQDTEHGKTITAVVSKKCVNDESLAAFIAKSCRNFATALDDWGRSALHLAVSTDRYAIAEWLINHGANVNGRDKTGDTPLHFSIYYGYIDSAVLLLRYGASLEITNNEVLNPLHYCCKPSSKQIESKQHNKEVLVWGKNKNYNLGIGNEEGKLCPQHVDYFRRQNISIRAISISIYHCLYTDEDGYLYVVGHGKGGRLGTGDENTLVVPQLVKFKPQKKTEIVKAVSAARNHSLILTNIAVYSCGLNTHSQLGFKSITEKQSTFKKVQFLCKTGIFIGSFVGIIAKEYYSIAYTTKDIYVWGLNGGQFGNKYDSQILETPTKLQSYDYEIDIVDSSNAAIVAYTSVTNMLLLYYNFKIKSIKAPKHEHIKNVSIDGGHLQFTDDDMTKPDESLKIIVHTDSNKVYIWYEHLQQYVNCDLSLNSYVSIQKLLWCKNNIFLIAQGELFYGKISLKGIKIDDKHNTEEYELIHNRKDICNSKIVKIVCKRIQNIDRVINICCDQNGESFCVLQESSKRYLNIPKLIIPDINFKSLMLESNTVDTIHDVVFHVEDEIFPAHKFIVFSKAKGLQDIVEQTNDKHVYLNYDRLTSKMFELILKHIYTNYILTLTDVENIETSVGPCSGMNNVEIFTTFREYAGKFGLSQFPGTLGKISLSEKQETIGRLNRTSFPELYDVTIKCANNLEIKAHKCVLVARMEYFHVMFNNSWSETGYVNLTTLSIEYVESIIDFLYTNDADSIRNKNYSDIYIYNMIAICDQYFINQLRNICEYLLIDKISIKKCGDMLEFASSYNCKILEQVCLDFIVQNIARILENHALNYLDQFLLHKINQFYRKIFNIFTDRIILTSRDAITDDMLESSIRGFKVDLNYKSFVDQERGKVKKLINTSNIVTQNRRRYEKDAIDSIKQNFVNQESDTIGATSVVISEAKNIAADLLSEAKHWTKVEHKKDDRKKVMLAGLKSNEILLNENKGKEIWTGLNNNDKSKYSENVPADTLTVSEPEHNDGDKNRTHSHTISLGSFTPQRSKRWMLQQRRKSSTTHTTLTSQPSELTTPPKPIINTNNENNAQSDTFAEIMKSPNKSPITYPINIPKAISPQTACDRSQVSPGMPFSFPSPKSKSLSISFEDSFISQIIQKEKKEKIYYDKIKTKSLVLTQIEERAIDELKIFYNVDTIYDEFITVERACHIKPTMNYALWHLK